MISKTFAFALLLLGSAVSASAVELVTNGDFEAAPLGSGWTLDSTGDYLPDEVFGNWNEGPDDPVPPTTTAWLGGYDDGLDTISQTISTAGYSHATFTMDATSDAAEFDNPDDPYDFLTVSFGGVQLAKYDLGSPGIDYFKIPISLDLTPYLDGTDKMLAVSVTTDISNPTSVYLDNLSIQAQPVPEPASMAALGLGALAVIRRRRR